MLYLRTLAPGLLSGDSGEFQFAAWLGGLAHPTGYPLYLMLGWVWAHLVPWHDPAWRMNALSALCGAVATGLVYLLALRMVKAVLRPASPLLGEGELPPGSGGLGGGAQGSPSPRRGDPSASLLGGCARVRGKVALRLVALFAALTFAVTPTFWSQAIIAEVYALNAVFVAAILLGVVSWTERLDRRWLYTTAFVFGLSLAHHRTTLLYIPAIVVFLWLTWRAREGEQGSAPREGEEGGSGGAEVRSLLQPRVLASLIALVCLPLLFYAYIPLRAPHVPYLQVEISSDQTLELYRPTLEGFVEHVSGQGFGAAIGAGRVSLAEMAATTGLFIRELTIPGLLLGLLGLTWLGVRSRPLLALTALGFLALVGFNLVYGIGDIYVYYIPAYLIWVLWMAVGVAACGCVGAWAFATAGTRGNGGAADKSSRCVTHDVPSPRHRNEAQDSRNTQLATRITYHAIRNTHHRGASLWDVSRLAFLVCLFPCLLAFALPVYLLIEHFPQNDRSHDISARTAWEAILSQPILQDVILVTNDRDEMVPQWYLKYVEGRRPDLTGLFPLIQPGSEWADVGAVVDSALRSSRPVYLIKPMPGLEVKFALEAVPMQAQGLMGGLVRVVGPAVPQPSEHPAAVVYDDTIRLDGYDLKPATLAPGETAEITLYWQPLKRLDADYTTFVHLVDADGARLAQSDHRPGGVYYPTSLWKRGEVLIDRHMLALPADLGPGPYSIVVGLYDRAADIQHLGEPQVIGKAVPSR